MALIEYLRVRLGEEAGVAYQIGSVSYIENIFGLNVLLFLEPQIDLFADPLLCIPLQLPVRYVRGSDKRYCPSPVFQFSDFLALPNFND